MCLKDKNARHYLALNSISSNQVLLIMKNLQLRLSVIVIAFITAFSGDYKIPEALRPKPH